MSGDIVDLHVANEEFIPEWARAMPGRLPRTREARLLDLLQKVDRALNKRLYPEPDEGQQFSLEQQLEMTLAQHHVKKTLIEFGRDPS